MPHFTAIDYNAGLGGRTLVWQRAGFNIIAAVEDDLLQRDFYKMMSPDVPLFFTTEAQVFPSVDVFLGSLTFPGFSIAQKARDDSKTIDFIKLLFHIKPKIFVLQLPNYALKSPWFDSLSTALYHKYNLSYQTLKESNYSGLPISGSQLYFVGIHRDMPIQFHFPSPAFSRIEHLMPREDPSTVDPWYRKLPVSLGSIPELDDKQYFYRSFGRDYRTTWQVPSSNPSQCFLVDTLGPRRLTHLEYGRLKGYPEEFLLRLPRNQRMYRLLNQAPDLYVADAVSQCLYSALNEAHQVQFPPQPTVSTQQSTPPSPEDSTHSIVEPRNIITRLYIESLKGLQHLEITFGSGLTAIMGVNGAGKSTILHALACMFSPFRNGENHKFNFFFTPTPDASWQGSSLSLTYFDDNTQTEICRKYAKSSDRWTPRYSSRPKREVFYIGIDSGLPEIEKERQTSFIDYLTDVDGDRLSSRVATAASKILRKDYRQLTTHRSMHKKFFGVRTASDITYSSLTMGAGEQRLIKILTTVYHASPYSLILIDELDLLLHVDAQRQLIEVLAQQATQKHLQIIFTTHSLTIGQLTDLVEVRYLYHTCEKTVVFDRITSDIMYDLCRITEQSLSIYVEDDLTEAIVAWITKSLKLARCSKITNIGSASNAFTLAAGWVIDGVALDNRLVILDGDVYRTPEEKEKQLANVLSGTEKNHHERIDSAMTVLTQLQLPNNTSPEKFIYDLIICLDQSDEITDCAKQITSVTNSHDWIDGIVSRMHQDRKLVLYQIVELVSESEQWLAYIEPIHHWLQDRQKRLNPSVP